MPAREANIAPRITQVTFKLVHYALLIYQLRFVFTMLAESWSLKGMTIRVTSFPAIFSEACNGCWPETLEFTKVLMVELIR